MAILKHKHRLEIEMKGQVSKTRKVVNEIVGHNTYGTGAYIDRIGNGLLSLKVWNWGEKTYDVCANMLRGLGCQVIKRSYRYKSGFVQYRLWIME